MLSAVVRPACLLAAALVVLPGCLFVPRSQLTALEAKNRALAEENTALAAQYENLKIHSRNIQDQLARREDEVTLFSQRAGGRSPVDAPLAPKPRSAAASPATARRLARLSEQFPSLRLEGAAGVGKLDTDLLFDEGRADLKPGAEEVLRDLVGVLQSPEGSDLRLLVVGHTDDQPIARRPLRDKYPDNFHLSTARALAVSEVLRRLGLDPDRVGIAGFGAHQPVASNRTDDDRAKNRRVELFVMVPDVPVIGWVESTPSLY